VEPVAEHPDSDASFTTVGQPIGTVPDARIPVRVRKYAPSRIQNASARPPRFWLPTRRGELLVERSNRNLPPGLNERRTTESFCHAPVRERVQFPLHWNAASKVVQLSKTRNSTAGTRDSRPLLLPLGPGMGQRPLRLIESVTWRPATEPTGIIDSRTASEVEKPASRTINRRQPERDGRVDHGGTTAGRLGGVVEVCASNWDDMCGSSNTAVPGSKERRSASSAAYSVERPSGTLIE
jgi:hypothetical protein